MKYRAVIEKLDWTGKVIRTVSEYEDSFKADFDPLFEEFVKTGKLPLSKLSKPDISYWDIMRKVAPQKSPRSFDEYAPGIRAVAGEYCRGCGVQFVCAAPGIGSMSWVETNRDITEA